MKIFRGGDRPAAPADPKTFSGSAHTTRIAEDEAGTPVHVYRVEFDNGGRTHWHRHTGPQWLFIVEGRVRVQTADGAPVDVAAGDAVVIPPGEKHWHGAAPGSRGVHLAVNVDATTEWLEAVTEKSMVKVIDSGRLQPDVCS
jgi:quercetin dioxygenase-like cupin family protein